MLFEVRTGRVRDHVRFDGELTLYVDAEAGLLVRAIAEAQTAIHGITEKSTEEEQRTAAFSFASAIFGREQAASLMNFYHHDAACVLNVCGKYFTQRLGKLITKAQKRQK